MNDFKRKVQELLSLANIKINGKNQRDIRVNNPAFYHRVMAGGSLALGESYMDGWWDCKQLDEFFTRIFKAELERNRAHGEKRLR